MLLGNFDANGRPYLTAWLVIHELDLAAPISFLVDTGADSTMLAPADAQSMGIDLNNLQESALSVGGIGGESTPYSIQAEIMVTDRGKAYFYPIDLKIPKPQDVPENMPSLLGQNILRYWMMRHSPSTDDLRFDVKR